MSFCINRNLNSKKFNARNLYDSKLVFFFVQEMFVKNLATISREKSKDKMNVNYKDLAEVVNSDDVLQFLQGTCKKNCETSKADVIPVYKF